MKTQAPQPAPSPTPSPAIRSPSLAEPTREGPLLAPPLVEDTTALRLTAAEGVRGAGAPLPHLARIQESFGRHDVRSVKAHADARAAASTAALGAEAFATGGRIAFRQPRPDLRTAAHEAAHIVQQRGGVELDEGVGQAEDPYERHAEAVAEAVVQGRSAEGLLAAFLPAGAYGEAPPWQGPSDQTPGRLVQRLDSQLDGPPRDSLPAGAPSNTAYAGHAVNLPAGFALTGACNGPAQIITAGEMSSKLDSDPATPTNMPDYTDSKKWSKGGGLLNDASVTTKNQAATKMHAINHHLDPAALNDPVKENIFIGTKVSNNPQHRALVETAVINSVSTGSPKYWQLAGDPGAYEAEMANPAIEDTHDVFTGERLLYWAGNVPGPMGANIDPNAVKHASLKRTLADNTNYGAGVYPTAMALFGTYNEIGWSLPINKDTANNNFLHPWVDYTVTPVYQGLPSYILANIERETQLLAFTPQLNAIGTFLAGNLGELGRLLRSLNVPVPVADVALIVGEAAEINPATAVQILQAMGAPAAFSVLRLLPVTTIRDIVLNIPMAADQARVVVALPLNLAVNVIDVVLTANAAAAVGILGAMAPAASAQIFDQLPAARRMALTGAGFVAPLMPAVAPLALPASGAGALPPAGAAGATSLPEAARILQALNEPAAAAALLRYPAASARQILAAANPANSLDPLLAVIPTNHAADIIADVANANVNTAEGILGRLGDSKAGTILQFFPINDARPIVVARHGVGVAAAADLVRNLPANYATNMIDSIRANVNAATAGGILEALPPAFAAIIVERLPLASSTPLLTGAVIAAAAAGRIFERLPAQHAAQRIDHVANNINAARAGLIMGQISAGFVRANIFAELPAANTAAIIRGVVGAPAQAQMLRELGIDYAADVINSMVGGHTAAAAGIVDALGDLSAPGIIHRLPVASMGMIFRQLPGDPQRASLLEGMFNSIASHVVDWYLNNGHTVAMAAIINAMTKAGRKLSLYTQLPNAHRMALAAQGAPVPGGAGAAPAGLTPLPVGARPPGVGPAGVPAVAPAGLPAGVPAGLPNVAPAALPAGLAPGAAIPVGAALNAGIGDLAGTVEAVLGQIPAAQLRTAFTTLPAGDTATIAAGIPGGAAAVKTLRYRLEKLGSFPAWAKEACPTRFEVDVKYYTAAYDPNNIYDRFQEGDSYSTDIT